MHDDVIGGILRLLSKEKTTNRCDAVFCVSTFFFARPEPVFVKTGIDSQPGGIDSWDP
jgi:hypothetical protein